MIGSGIGCVKLIDGELFAFTKKHVEGYLITGPYLESAPGDYAVEFSLRAADADEESHEKVAAILDVVCDLGQTTLACREVISSELKNDALHLFELSFHLEKAAFLEFRVCVFGTRTLAVRLRRRLVDPSGARDFPPLRDPIADAACASDEMPLVFSRFAEINTAIIHADGRVPLFWVSSSRDMPFGNFGDALSPVVVAALSGLDPMITPTDDPEVRLVASGTVLNWQEKGRVHVWGAGLDPTIDCFFRDAPQGYRKPSNLQLRIHAVRGPLTRRALLDAGVECPEIYGDPGWLLPNIIPPAAEKTHELGIIPHIFEFDTQFPDSRVLEHLKCYETGSETGVKIISTRHAPSWEGFVGKIREITSCRRIISTSFHGLIVPQAYGIPAISFLGHSNNGLSNGDLLDENSNIDRRVRDFLLGAGYTFIPVYGRHDEERTDWSSVIKAVDAAWKPLVIDTEPFVGAFPLAGAHSEKVWEIPHKGTAQMRF